ncbi:acetyltransferase (GNAT) family protein [Micromonospora pisi]|uniref:Acetyltransferase (GNAT) family protein n=1 Tax=Micromonospora pisi TaxID=589240 RepID=A0A495JS38_9ACTN|nr:GNAT family N-acetyltransferase [Micromonospora pisi]RKR91328.1 acetyltransferase (GNAT) family protein [Micromonospora pisi]
MTEQLAVVGADSAAALIDPECPDVYHTAGYGRAAASTEPGTWQLAHSTHRILVPYVVRRLDDGTGASDAVSPYGYSGIHVGPGTTPTELARFWDRAVHHWRDQAMVTLFLRFSPLDPQSVDAVRHLGTIDLTRRADTITVPVDQGSTAIWAGMEGRSRTAIRKARNAGLEGGIRAAGIDDVAAGSPFRKLYEQTMVRVGSAPGYHFPEVYYRTLVDGLGKALLIAEVRDPGGTVVAAALVLRHRDRAHYHLAGSDPRSVREGANNLLLWTILEWAAENGCALVHLGGGVRADDGLFQFKRSFGGIRTPFWTGAVVLDPGRYAALLGTHARNLGRTVEELRETGYFPGYRLGRG